MTEKNEKIISGPENVLHHYWGYDAFRPLQKDIILHVLAGKDTLAILPTGGGKSVCFQVPALMLSGICLVISPLIALMKDQVFQLEKRGIAAAAVYSGMSNETLTETLNRAIDGHLRFLYVSPERLKTTAFRNALNYLRIGLLAVDEAHCISKWGHDFRPAYLEISEIRSFTPGQKYPVIALTATATREVRQDIIERLSLRTPGVYLRSFARENLSYRVQCTDQKELRLLEFLQKETGSAIVYTRTRKRTMEIAAFLGKNGIPADFYHAGLPLPERNKKQDQWLAGTGSVMVATNAFGMGIDKADVRTVVHTDLCDNLEAYYQESGRAGRDGKPCSALLLYGKNDILTLEKNLGMKYPGLSVLQRVYQCLSNYFQVPLGELDRCSYDFDLYRFSSTFGLDMLQTHYALKLLESQGIIFLSESYHQPSRLKFLFGANLLAEFQERNPGVSEAVKSVLRIYGGEVFNAFVEIRENEIASALGGSYSGTLEALNFLHRHRVIEYIPQKSAPQLSFLGFRYDADRLPLNHRQLSERKSNDRRSLKAMVMYAEQLEHCRMNVIQDYFDEEKTVPCGKCDVCTRNRQTGLSGANLLKNRIRGLLPAGVEDLQRSFTPEERETVAALIKKALASGELGMDHYGLIFVAR